MIVFLCPVDCSIMCSVCNRIKNRITALLDQFHALAISSGEATNWPRETSMICPRTSYFVAFQQARETIQSHA